MAVAEGQFVGRHVRKIFEGHGMFEGVVLAYNFKERLYNIGYTDGDSEEMTHAEVLDTIISQEEQVNLDGNVIELLSVRKDYDRLSRMLATKKRALGEIIESRKRQKTSHISSESLQKTDSWIQWQYEILEQLNEEAKKPIQYIDQNIAWKQAKGGDIKNLRFPGNGDDSDDTVVFQPAYCNCPGAAGKW